jgi:heat-inducible transcriptional repressor
MFKLMADLNKRSLEIFKQLVDAFMETGEPVGSRTLSRRLSDQLSPATIRNIMADLEDAGLLYAPHTSAGRLPTEKGLHFFVHGLLEVGDIDGFERKKIEEECLSSGKNFESVLDQATSMLSGLSRCAGLVLAPKTDSTLKHIEFVHLSTGRALVVLISQDGLVENRILEIPYHITPAVLEQASNYLSHHLNGKTLEEVRVHIGEELKENHHQLDQKTAEIVKAGLGVWAGGGDQSTLIVKGQSNLLSSVTEVNELEHIRQLFDILETKETLTKLLDASIQGEGVQIFIGAENSLFKLSGCSVIVSPFKNEENKILGAIGVVGPTRMNYGRIIPLVDFTAKAVGQFLKGGDKS